MKKHVYNRFKIYFSTFITSDDYDLCVFLLRWTASASGPVTFLSCDFLIERYVWTYVRDIHRESKKGCHHNHGHNFVNSWSIYKILSLLQRAVNFQPNPY